MGGNSVTSIKVQQSPKTNISQRINSQWVVSLQIRLGKTLQQVLPELSCYPGKAKEQDNAEMLKGALDTLQNLHNIFSNSQNLSAEGISPSPW